MDVVLWVNYVMYQYMILKHHNIDNLQSYKDCIQGNIDALNSYMDVASEVHQMIRADKKGSPKLFRRFKRAKEKMFHTNRICDNFSHDTASRFEEAFSFFNHALTEKYPQG